MCRRAEVSFQQKEVLSRQLHVLILGLKIRNLENGEFRGEDQWTESQTSVKMQKDKSTGEAQSLEFKEKRKCEGD